MTAFGALLTRIAPSMFQEAVVHITFVQVKFDS